MSYSTKTPQSTFDPYFAECIRVVRWKRVTSAGSLTSQSTPTLMVPPKISPPASLEIAPRSLLVLRACVDPSRGRENEGLGQSQTEIKAVFSSVCPSVIQCDPAEEARAAERKIQRRMRCGKSVAEKREREIAGRERERERL